MWLILRFYTYREAWSLSLATRSSIGISARTKRPTISEPYIGLCTAGSALTRYFLFFTFGIKRERMWPKFGITMFCLLFGMGITDESVSPVFLIFDIVTKLCNLELEDVHFHIYRTVV